MPYYPKFTVPRWFSFRTYLDGEREEVDLLEGLDLAVLHQAAKLGHRDPFLSSHVSVEN